MIYMLPKSNGRKGGEGLVQIQNTGKCQWEEFDAPGTAAKDQKLQKRYNLKISGIEPENRKHDMAPADEIKDYIVNGCDNKSIHVNTFGRLMDLTGARESSIKIDNVTSEEKVELLGSEAYKITLYVGTCIVSPVNEPKINIVFVCRKLHLLRQKVTDDIFTSSCVSDIL